MSRIPGLDRSPVDYVRGSYRLQVVVSLVSVILILSMTGGYLYIQVEGEFVDQTTESVESTSNSQAKQVGQWRSSLEHQTRLLSKSPVILSDNTTRIQSFLETEIRTKNNLPSDASSVHYLEYQSNGNYKIVASSSEDMRGFQGDSQSPFGDTDINFENPSRDSVYMSSPYTSAVSNETTLLFASPVDQTHAIAISVDLTEAADQFSSVEGGEVYVVNSEGTVVTSTLTDHVGVSGYEHGVITEQQFSHTQSVNGTYETEVMHHDKNRIAGYTSVTGTDWVVASEVPEKSALSVIHNVRDQIGMSIGFASFVLLGFTWVVGFRTLRDLTRLKDGADKLGQGDYDADFSSNRTDEIGQLFDEFDEVSSSLDQKITELKEKEEEQRQRNVSIETAVSEYRDVMDSASNGDLTARMQTGTNLEQLARLEKDFNEMLSELQTTVKDTKKFARDVASNSEEVLSGVSEVRGASNEVTESTQEISNGSTRQNQELDSVLNDMSDLSGSIEEVSASADNLSTRSQDAAEISAEGREAAENAQEAIEQIEEQTRSDVQTVENLNEQVEEISDIVGFIRDVAEMTNMLAINARIEAARADESGDEFDVVANEVKDLAVDTDEAAGEIEENLSNLKTQTKTTAENIEETMESVEHGAETIEVALNSHKEIIDMVESINVSVKEIDQSADNQSMTAQEVVHNMEEIASISEETASQTEDVAAASEEQTASLTQVSQGVVDLAERAVELNERLDHFDAGLGYDDVDLSPSDVVSRSSDHDADGDGNKVLSLDDIDIDSESDNDE